MTRPTVTSRGRRPAVFLLILAVVALVIAACGAAGGAPALSAGRDGGTDAQGEPVLGPAQPAPGSADQSGSGGSGTEGSGNGTSGSGQYYAVDRPDLLIIKTGSLSLQVPGLDSALAAASTKITALGGYVSGSSRKGDGDEQVATVTYRIPATQWDAALVALRGLADKVLAEQTQTQDVTGDVLDLGARITNLQATETALQGIMTKATKISDVLAVQEQLTQVRGEIEQLTTQKKHLEEQAAYSTLSVDFSLKPQAAVVTSQQQFDPNGEIDKASASLVEVLQAIATAGIWFAIVWLPILVVLGILGLIAFVIARRIGRSRGGPGTILPTPTGS